MGTDPNRGGLLERRYGRALGAAQGFSRLAPLAGWRARRRAHGELAAAGVLAQGSTARRPLLAEREPRTAVLGRVRRCVREEAHASPRDRELLLHMARSGLLSKWLPRDERRPALRRLGSGSAPEFQGLGALGLVSAAATAELFAEAGFGDFGGGEAAGLEAGGASEGGGGSQ